MKYKALPDESGLNWVIQNDEYERGKHNLIFFSELCRFGFELIENGDYKKISNLKYPLLMKYWYLMHESAAKRGVNVLLYITCCDFRLFASKYKRPFENLLYSLSDQYKQYFNELNNYVVNKKTKLGPPKYYHRYSYYYKTECVLTLDLKPMIVVPWSLKNIHESEALSLFISAAEKQPDKSELIEYIQKGICLCKACNSNCKNISRKYLVRSVC